MTGGEEKGRALRASATRPAQLHSSFAPAWLVVSVLLFRGSIDIAYIYYVNPAFSHHFFLPMALDPEAGRYVASWALFAAPVVLFLQNRLSLPSIALLIGVAFFFAPVSALYGLDANRSVAPALLSATALIAFGMISRLRIIPQRAPLSPADGGTDPFVYLLIAAPISLTLAWSIVSGAAFNMNFSLVNIYLYRSELSELMDVGGLAYLNQWTYKIFVPAGIVLAFLDRRWALLIGFMILQLYFFGVTQQRLILFVPFLSLGVAALYRMRSGVPALFLSLSALLLAATIASQWQGLSVIGEIGIRRTFFVPAAATYRWLQLFEHYPYVYWSDNLLASVSQNPAVDRALPSFVALKLIGRPDVNANVGLVGAGNAHAGLWGVLAYALLFGLVVNFAQSLIRSPRTACVAAALLVGPFRTVWADSDFPTALLTHGILVAIVVIYILSVRQETRLRRNTLGRAPPAYR